MIFKNLTAFGLLAVAAACSDRSETPSAEQDREMNEAAAMLDEAPASLSNIDDAGLSAEQRDAAPEANRND